MTCQSLRSVLLWCTLLFIITVHTEEVFNTTPVAIRSSFSCRNRPMGFYADVETNCKAYYTCDEHGNKFTYRCPERTAFRQDALVCDHAHLVNCQATIYPSIQSANDENNASTTFTIKPSIASIDSINDNRLSYSRSFRVIQQPDKSSASNKNQLGFVFSGSVFLRDRDRTPRNRSIIDNICRTCNSKNQVTTVRTSTYFPNTSRQPQTTSSFFKNRSNNFSQDRNIVHIRRPFETTSRRPSSLRTTTPTVTQTTSPFLFERSASSNIYNGNYHLYSETLRSIQANAVASNTKYTTSIPAYAFTLKPLVPNELPNDPYYPKHPTSTEAYYTPSDRKNTRIINSSKTFGHSSLPFKIPSVLPDLNTLEDLVDRRKFFYIPRIKVI